MKSLNLLVAFIGLSINPVSSCYLSGTKFEDRGLARQYAAELCNGEFEGFYAPLQVKKKCIQLSPSQKIEFTVESTNYFGQTQLVDHWCSRPLDRLIKVCSRGGNVDHGEFFFKVDPNDGKC